MTIAEKQELSAMLASVRVVHDEQSTRELAVSALRKAFLEAVGFADPMAALVGFPGFARRSSARAICR